MVFMTQDFYCYNFVFQWIIVTTMGRVAFMLFQSLMTYY